MVTEYLLPDSADQAASQLAGGAAVMAGGTTVMPAVLAGSLAADARDRPRPGGPRRRRAPRRADRRRRDRHARRRRGSTMRPRWPRRPAAVGGPALRNMATIGGNLLAGRPYGDVGVALLALGADVELGDRTVPLDRFWDEFRPGEDLVRAVSFDDAAAAGSVYVRWARRAANSPAVVCVAVAGGRVAIGGVAEHPDPVGGRRGPLDDPAAAGAAAAGEVDPPTDGIASGWYRRRMTEVFVRRAVEESRCRLRSSSSSSTAASRR